MKPVDLEVLEALAAKYAAGGVPGINLSYALLKAAPALLPELRAARRVVSAARNVQIPLLKDDSSEYPIPSWGYDLNAAITAYDAAVKEPP